MTKGNVILHVRDVEIMGNKDKINKGENRSKKAAPHTIIQPETPKN